jgi:hypothetical protein
MKLKVDDKEIYELQKWQEDVIKNDISEEMFEEDMIRRTAYFWQHKFDQCYMRLEKEWLEKLRADPSVSSIPTDKKTFVEIVLSRSDYKNRSQREAEEKSKHPEK